MSSRRLHTAAWSIVALYFSILITDISKAGVVPFFVTPTQAGARSWLLFPTLVFFVVNALEAYLWLNPPPDAAEDVKLTGTAAGRVGLSFTTYLLSVMCQTFLLDGCTNLARPPKVSLTVWSSGVASVLFFYAMYNVVGLLWPDHDKLKERKAHFHAIELYVPFCLGFLLLATAGGYLSDCVRGALSAGLFVVYLVVYIYVWYVKKRWYLSVL